MLTETEIGHVSLGHHADVVCIAPATAHTLAKLALGLADDLVTTTGLATRAPLVIAPAHGRRYVRPPGRPGERRDCCASAARPSSSRATVGWPPGWSGRGAWPSRR